MRYALVFLAVFLAGAPTSVRAEEYSEAEAKRRLQNLERSVQKLPRQYTEAELREMQQELKGGVFEHLTLPQIRRALATIEKLQIEQAKQIKADAERKALEKRWAEGNGFSDKPIGLSCDTCAPGAFRSER